jgi:hypothetical protein
VHGVFPVKTYSSDWDLYTLYVADLRPCASPSSSGEKVEKKWIKQSEENFNKHADRARNHAEIKRYGINAWVVRQTTDWREVDRLVGRFGL